jgi:hypothetical protein
MGPCLCELASGLVRKLQRTEAKVSDQTLLCELLSGLVSFPTHTGKVPLLTLTVITTVFLILQIPNNFENLIFIFRYLSSRTLAENKYFKMMKKDQKS